MECRPGASDRLLAAERLTLSQEGGASAPTAAAHGGPTIFFHGDADPTVHPANGEQVMAACTGTGS